MIWVWSVSLPLTLLNSTEVNPGVSARDVVGAVMFVVGFVFELGSDVQKDIFKVRVLVRGVRVGYSFILSKMPFAAFVLSRLALRVLLSYRISVSVCAKGCWSRRGMQVWYTCHEGGGGEERRGEGMERRGKGVVVSLVMCGLTCFFILAS